MTKIIHEKKVKVEDVTYIPFVQKNGKQHHRFKLFTSNGCFIVRQSLTNQIVRLKKDDKVKVTYVVKICGKRRKFKVAYAMEVVVL